MPINLLEDEMQNKTDAVDDILSAPGKIGEDIYNRASNIISSIPEYLNAAKTEVPGFFSSLKNHPLHMGGQAIAGLSEMGAGLINTPKNIGSYISDRLNFPVLGKTIENSLIPSNFQKFVPTSNEMSSSASEVFGEPKYPGEKLLRGGLEKFPELYGAGLLARNLNPLNLTSRGIVRNVAREQDRQMELHGRQYDQIFNQANNLGLGGNLQGIIPHLDFNTIFRGEPHNARVATNEFIQNPNTRTAHHAKSDLLGMQRKLRSKYEREGLNSGETRRFNAINNAIQNIEANMFTDIQGNVHQGLSNSYRGTQESYNANVLPYTQNKKLQEYRRGDLRAKEVLPTLQLGKFAARRTASHPAIPAREIFKKALIAAGLGGGTIAGGKTIYDWFNK